MSTPSSAKSAPTVPASFADRLAEARRAWPGVEVDPDAFARHVASRSHAESGSERVADLFIAFACSQRSPLAIAAFEAAYFGEVEATRRRFDSLPVTADDVVQRVRQKLFLDDPPALAGYEGRGDLRGWVRAAVLHMLVNIATREAREQPTDEGFFDAVVDAGADAEATYLRQACRAEFEQAFEAALARLEPRERTILRYAFADRLNVDRIGAVYGVHRATAARWVQSARDRLVTETRADLMARLRVDEEEAVSILRVALSRMGTTLLRRFA